MYPGNNWKLLTISAKVCDTTGRHNAWNSDISLAHAPCGLGRGDGWDFRLQYCMSSHFFCCLLCCALRKPKVLVAINAVDASIEVVVVECCCWDCALTIDVCCALLGAGLLERPFAAVMSLSNDTFTIYFPFCVGYCVTYQPGMTVHERESSGSQVFVRLWWTWQTGSRRRFVEFRISWVRWIGKLE